MHSKRTKRLTQCDQNLMITEVVTETNLFAKGRA